MRKLFRSFVLLLVATAMAACSSDDDFVNENLSGDEGELVRVSVSTSGWSGGVATRSAAMLMPVNVLVFQKEQDDVVSVQTTGADGDISLRLKTGEYDLVAVCGLKSDQLPTKRSDFIAIDAGTDFAVGTGSVKIADGVCTPAVVNIYAQRQMVWLEVDVKGIPADVSKFNLYVKGVSDRYSLDDSWTASSAEVEEAYTRIPVENVEGQYKGSWIMPPCVGGANIMFVAEVTTMEGITKVLTYTSPTELEAGVHLTQTLLYEEMMLVEGGVSLGGWDNCVDDGELENGFGFALGQQYFSLPATVVNISSDGKTLNLLAHRPMLATLDEIKTWNLKSVPYTLAPEIGVLRWAFPTSSATMQNVVYAIDQVGWDAIDNQFRANGLNPIDREAENILAYMDKTTGLFYTYNFKMGMFRELPADAEGVFWVYAVGIIQVSE